VRKLSLYQLIVALKLLQYVKTNYFPSKSTACSVAWNRLGWWLGVLETTVPAGKVTRWLVHHRDAGGS